MEGSLLDRHGYLLVTAITLARFAGLPLPASAVLVFVGALASATTLSTPGLVAAAALGAVLADTLWFGLGRRGGRGLIHVYCRLTLGSGACVQNTERFFLRFGMRSLAIAKFVPGLATFAAPMAGLSGASLTRFWLWDGAGSLLWAGAFVLLGRVAGLGLFYRWADWIDRSGPWLIWIGAGLLAALLTAKIMRRARHGVAVALASPHKS